MKTIILLTKPVPVNQKHVHAHGRLILTNKYRQAKEAMQWEVRSVWKGEPLQDDVTLNVMFYYGDNRKRDIDAYLKILLDSMSGIVFEDDSQINELHVFKEVDKVEPRTVIQVL